MTFRRDPLGWWNSLGRPLRRIPRPAALLLLAALILALAWSSFATVKLADDDSMRVAALSGEDIGDLELYKRVHDRFHAGEDYYAAALSEQRANDYPTRPFFTVRLPTLAWIDGIIGNQVWTIIALGLLVIAIIAWLDALAPLTTRIERCGAGVLLFIGAAGLFDARALLFHDLLAGMLLTVAMGLYRPYLW